CAAGRCESVLAIACKSYRFEIRPVKSPFNGSQRLEVLDQIALLSVAQPQLEELVVVIDDRVEIREAAVVVKAALGVRHQSPKRRGPVASVRRAIGLEIIDPDLGGLVCIPSRLREDWRHVTARTPGLAGK